MEIMEMPVQEENPGRPELRAAVLVHSGDTWISIDTDIGTF